MLIVSQFYTNIDTSTVLNFDPHLHGIIKITISEFNYSNIVIIFLWMIVVCLMYFLLRHYNEKMPILVFIVSLYYIYRIVTKIDLSFEHYENTMIVLSNHKIFTNLDSKLVEAIIISLIEVLWKLIFLATINICFIICCLTSFKTFFKNENNT